MDRSAQLPAAVGGGGSNGSSAADGGSSSSSTSLERTVTLSAGDYIGESALVVDGNRSATVRVASPGAIALGTDGLMTPDDA